MIIVSVQQNYINMYTIILLHNTICKYIGMYFYQNVLMIIVYVQQDYINMYTIILLHNRNNL